jgi:hypothetical protein
MVKPPSSSVGIQCIGFNLRNSSVLVSSFIGLVGITSCGIPFSTHRAIMGFTLPEMGIPYSLRDIRINRTTWKVPTAQICTVTEPLTGGSPSHSRKTESPSHSRKTESHDFEDAGPFRNLKPNQEMTSDSNDAAAPASEAAAGGVTKTAAKNAKSDAQKYYKKKSDPEGLKKIEQGDEAFK